MNNHISRWRLAAAFVVACLTSACGSGSTSTSGTDPDTGAGSGSGSGDAEQAPVAASKDSKNLRKPTTEFTAHDAAKPLNFIIIGDVGTQDSVQAGLAKTLAALCVQKATPDVPGCAFALAAGDNIYMIGAQSPYDAQFNTAFEDLYGAMKIPFYLVLGNHDNGGTGNLTVFGDNQVEYHHRSDRPSKNWNMPARYYSHRWGNVLELFAIDSDTLDGDGPSGGTDSQLYDTAFQRKWTSEAIRLSPARWKMSMGHYNYISNGNYGDGTPTFKKALEEAVCDKVQFHIQGHEHDMRWLKPVKSCGRTEFIVSGAGGHVENRPALNLGFEERKGRNGISDYRASAAFMWASLLGDHITVEWYGDNAEGLNPQKPIEVFELTRQELGW